MEKHTMSKMKRQMEKEAEKQAEKELVEKQPTPPAVKYDNPWLEVAAENSGRFGKLLKFVKGRWESGDDELPIGTEFIAHIDQLAKGWIHFENNEVVGEPIIVKIADGKKLPTREELPDNNPKKWEKDDNGNPRDPWAKQWYLPLVSVETGELHTYVTGSDGGDQAITNLCNVYGHKVNDGMLPIVALRSSGYKHKKFGRIKKPELPIVGWDGTPPAAIPMQPPPNADMGGDAVPY